MGQVGESAKSWISLVLVVVQILLTCCNASWEIDSHFSADVITDRPFLEERAQEYGFHPRWNGGYCHCVDVHECPAALEIFRKRSQSIYDMDLITKFSCGMLHRPHFCCNLIVESIIFKHHMKQKRDYARRGWSNGWNSGNSWNSEHAGNSWNSGHSGNTWNSAHDSNHWSSNRPGTNFDERAPNHHFFWDSGSFPHWSHAPTGSNVNNDWHNEDGHDCEHDNHKPRKPTTKRPRWPKTTTAAPSAPSADNDPSAPLAPFPNEVLVTSTAAPTRPPDEPSVIEAIFTPDGNPSSTTINPETISMISESTTPSNTISTIPTTIGTTPDPLDAATTREEKRNILAAQLCGTSLRNRIVGGEEAQLGDYPWMARLGYVRNGAEQVLFRCGGTLISNRYILTAAHCVTNLPNDLVLTTVRLGELDERTDVDCSGTDCADPPQDFGIESITVHPNYNTPRLSNDIALVKLNGSVRMTGFVSPLCLPFEGTPERVSNFTGLRAVVAGWGSTNTGITIGSPTLQWVRLTIIPTEECIQTYRSRFSITISPNQLCTAGIENMDACEGDSGGPLFVEGDGTRKATLIGIVSFGPRRCGTAALPGVYTNVQSYLDWILDSI